VGLTAYLLGQLAALLMPHQWNRVYVISSEQGVIIKRVRKGTDMQHITLVSENTDYEPFELPLNKIHSIALVVGIVRAE
ncbi:MAG: helix-turn-helix transcriptional regulator, partial [Alistipes sp.]